MYNTQFSNDSILESKLNSLTGILERVTEIVASNKSRNVQKQVEILLDRADKNNEEYGKRFYDHSYIENIDIYKLEDIRMKLYDKVLPYERNLKINKTERNSKDVSKREQNI